LGGYGFLVEGGEGKAFRSGGQGCGDVRWEGEGFGVEGESEGLRGGKDEGFEVEEREDRDADGGGFGELGFGCGWKEQPEAKAKNEIQGFFAALRMTAFLVSRHGGL
jgi:hypothetical protein